MPQAQTISGTVVGYFDSRADAVKAVDALRDAGFSSANVGVAHRDEEPLSTSETRTDATREHTSTEKTGGVWDKVKNFFDGGSAEPYADETQRGDLASREVTPDGDSYGSHDLQGTLNGMSVPEDRSRYFGHRFGTSDAGALVTVTAPGREGEAAEILERFGADLGNTSDTYDYAQTPTRTQDTGDTRGTEGMQNMQLLGEVLRVHKDRVSRGEVTLRKEVRTEMQTIQVPVTREELVIERHAASGTTPASGTIGDTGEIRIPLTEEVASADKSTFVREEVSVGKRAVQDVRDVSGEVRSEELVVEDETKSTPTR